MGIFCSLLVALSLAETSEMPLAGDVERNLNLKVSLEEPWNPSSLRCPANDCPWRICVRPASRESPRRTDCPKRRVRFHLCESESWCYAESAGHHAAECFHASESRRSTSAAGCLSLRRPAPHPEWPRQLPPLRPGFTPLCGSLPPKKSRNQFLHLGNTRRTAHQHDFLNVVR